MVSLTAFLNEQWGTTERGKTGQRFARPLAAQPRAARWLRMKARAPHPGIATDSVLYGEEAAMGIIHVYIIYIYNGDDHDR